MTGVQTCALPILIPVCPEVFGGLPVPRTDAQRRGSSVVTRDGRDVTGQYSAGAEEAVRLALEHRVVCAIMKEKSPSCGSSMIYDGSFSGKLIEGEGLASELLRKAGVRVFSENQLDEVEKLINTRTLLEWLQLHDDGTLVRTITADKAITHDGVTG